MLDYGIVGNCVTCALVKKNASVEWMCFPDFSSPSVFAKILDRKKGGSFDIVPVGRYKTTQKYIHNTAILETVFDGGRDSFVVYDFFPRYNKLLKKGSVSLVKKNRLVRIVRPLKGKPVIRIKYNPRPDYAMLECKSVEDEGDLICSTKESGVRLSSNVSVDCIARSKPIRLDFTKYFVVGGVNENSPFSVKRCNKLLSDTRRYWHRWVDSLVLPEGNRDTIIRSAITLKLLTYSASGAIVAASTTSIPEEMGKERNWDYRFCWLRDAAFCVDALKKLGRDYEPKSLIEFILKRVMEDDHIQPIYGIHGETRLREKELNHLEGFKGSKPVRIGNAAYSQRQNDIYGSIIDILYLYFVYYEYEKKLTKKQWNLIKYVVNQIRFNWEKKDSSIWEYRNLYDHYTYSKFMCYVGVDRAIKIAQKFGREEFINKWLELKEEIREDILENAYDTNLNSFTMSYGNKKLDASLLLMTYHEFLPPDDPRIINTVRAIYEKLRKGYKVKRYDIEDDFGGSRNAFTICTFWLIDALYYIGEVKKARSLYNQIIKRGKPLGLFSEGIDMTTGKLLGNFPQAYTHIAIINSSIFLSEWSSKRKKIDWGILTKRKKRF